MNRGGLIVITVQRELYKGADYSAYYAVAGWLRFQVKVELMNKQKRQLISALLQF